MHSPTSRLIAGVPFSENRLFSTEDLEEAREICGRVLSPHALHVVGGGQHLQARMDHLKVGPLSLNRLTWGANVNVNPDRLENYYLLSIPVTGNAHFRLGEKLTRTSPLCAGIVSWHPSFRFTASADFDQVLVRIERSAMESAWYALSGRSAERPIDFLCGLPLHSRAWCLIEPQLRLLACCARGQFDPRAVLHLSARIEDFLCTALLIEQPHTMNISFARHQEALPAHLRRAKDFMMQNLEIPITLGRVAEHCGVSRRTLQAAFQREHGIGPMQWLRRERLQASCDALQYEDRVKSVSEIALRFGFTNLGDFSKQYREQFGETPSETLRRR